MKTSLIRARWGIAATLAAQCFAPALSAQGAPRQMVEAISSESLDEFTHPHTLVDIGGRKLNLVCMGSGDKTVLFDAGGSDWSVIWALVQPSVARRTRACSYDRAGLGYSDPAPGARSPVAVAEDLH